MAIVKPIKWLKSLPQEIIPREAYLAYERRHGSLPCGRCKTSRLRKKRMKIVLSWYAKNFNPNPIQIHVRPDYLPLIVPENRIITSIV